MKLIRNTRLVANGLITRCDIGIAEGRIAAVEPPGKLNGEFLLDAQGLYLSHGFIDTHVHGGGGGDFMDGTREAWHAAAVLHFQHGTTGMLPTTLASGQEELKEAFRIYQECMKEGGFEDGAKFFGIHVEGPYLAPTQCGAQDPAFIRDPEPEEYRDLLEAGVDIRRWTIAPERPGALQMGDFLTEPL